MKEFKSIEEIKIAVKKLMDAGQVCFAATEGHIEMRENDFTWMDEREKEKSMTELNKQFKEDYDNAVFIDGLTESEFRSILSR